MVTFWVDEHGKRRSSALLDIDLSEIDSSHSEAAECHPGGPLSPLTEIAEEPSGLFSVSDQPSGAFSFTDERDSGESDMDLDAAFDLEGGETGHLLAHDVDANGFVVGSFVDV